MTTQTETRGRPTKGIGRVNELYIHANEYTTELPSPRMRVSYIVA